MQAAEQNPATVLARKTNASKRLLRICLPPVFDGTSSYSDIPNRSRPHGIKRLPVSSALSEAGPTNTPYSPDARFQRLSTSLNVCGTRGSIATVTCCDSPGASVTRFHPARRLNDSSESFGSLAYTCAISVPARLPVFLTLKVTVFAAEFTLKPE